MIFKAKKMIEALALILIIVLLSRLFEEITGIPIIIPVIVLSFFFGHFMPDVFHITSEVFDEILIMLLPIILFPEVINFSVREFKENFDSIFYLAFIGVAIEIVIGVAVIYYFFNEYDLSIGALACLLAPLMATDAITVTSMANKFNLPERLRIVAEGESLFNDATAIIAFFFVALPLFTRGDIGILNASVVLVKVFVFSTLIGITVALIGYILLKTLRDPIEQFSAAYLVAIFSFLIADLLHYSGILSILVSLMFFRVLIDKEIQKGFLFQQEFQKALEQSQEECKDDAKNIILRIIEKIQQILLKIPALSSVTFRTYRKEAIYIAVFANAVLFTLIAQLANLELLKKYWIEILVVFILTTAIRFCLVYGLKFLKKFPLRWINALTFSGMKGGLALIMIHSLPEDFYHKDMFETIVLGVVFLSIFTYTGFLMIYLNIHKKEFSKDKVEEETCIPEEILLKDLEEIIEKDPITGIFNRIKFEEILSYEIQRAYRYKTPLSIILIEFVNYQELKEKLGEEELNNLLVQLRDIVKQDVSILDPIGRLKENTAAILTINKTIEDDLSVVNKIKSDFEKFAQDLGLELKMCFSIASYVEGDTPDLLIEKAEDALNRAKVRNCSVVGIAI